MKDLYIEGTKGVFFTPTIRLNAETGRCEILGESYIEDAPQFYEPILNWIDSYVKEVRGTLTWDFRLVYFNTSSSKTILNLLQTLKNYEKQGGQVIINWYYPDDNDDLLAEGEDFVEDSGLKINLLPYALEDEDEEEDEFTLD